MVISHGAHIAWLSSVYILNTNKRGKGQQIETLPKIHVTTLEMYDPVPAGSRVMLPVFHGYLGNS